MQMDHWVRVPRQQNFLGQENLTISTTRRTTMTMTMIHSVLLRAAQLLPYLSPQLLRLMLKSAGEMGTQFFPG
jgi:hypothetical protein